jgi:hypothetical protein
MNSMIVIGASVGPRLGESPIGIAVTFSSARAIPKINKKTKQEFSIFIVFKKGDVAASPFASLTIMEG